MLADIKFSQAQLSKIIQSGGFFGKTIGNIISNLCKKALIYLVVPLAENVLPKLATKAKTSPAIDKFERKISGRGAVRAGKGFTLFISNEDMDDIIKIVKSLEDSGLLIDGAIETVKHEIKKQEGGFLRAMMTPMAASLKAPMASSLMQFVASSLINAITGRGVRSAGKGQEDGTLPLLALPLMMKV